MVIQILTVWGTGDNILRLVHQTVKRSTIHKQGTNSGNNILANNDILIHMGVNTWGKRRINKTIYGIISNWNVRGSCNHGIGYYYSTT